ncbi:TATA-binding protein-associated factor 172 [Palaemon carinicauda]|uniref:TATA-binding protein-associated factor 172 n=1 Tax=Palaemon carinicauda TaxID=392227 RepID=UPI0035B66174
MTSRLDRLFVLLENGGTGVTRQAAAQQLGEVVRLHPHELGSLLNRVKVYLGSKSWETRIAAGQAVEAIVKNVPQWDPEPSKVQEDWEENDPCKSQLGRLSLESLDINRVLESGSYLMAADEKSFELSEENVYVDPVTRIAHQRNLINKRLGLDVAEAIGVDTSNIFSNEDLADCNVGKVSDVTQERDSILNIVKEKFKSPAMALSSRERNRARRKAKLLIKQKSVDMSECNPDEGPERKRPRICSKGLTDEAYSDDESQMVVDEGPASEEVCEWPLEMFCNLLSTDLFSVSWESRHGAATALRQIISIHGQGAGKATYHSKEQMEKNHQAWLEDMAVRFLCVLALDRFGDFVSDQVVAPVRETCAQALGGILNLLCESGVYDVLSVLEKLLSSGEWEARHGGLLGLKYLLAVRADIRSNLMTHAYPHIFKGLQDEMDDVVAVAASCLVPVADSVVQLLEKEVVAKLISTLWDSLLDIDDLTSSTNSILLLLSKLLAHPALRDSGVKHLTELVPRLWPFLYHTSSSVRGSALKTLDTLTSLKSGVRARETGNAHVIKEEKDSSESESDKVTLKVSNTHVIKEEKDSSESESDKVTLKVSNTHVIKEEKDSSESESDKVTLKVSNTHVIKEEKDSSESESDKMTLKVSNIQIGEVKMEETCLEDDKSSDNSVINNNDSKIKDCTNFVASSLSPGDWLSLIIKPALTHIFQRALLEQSSDNLELVFKIWEQMLENVSLSYLLMAVCPLVASWLYLAMASPKVPLDPSLLLIAHHNISREGKKLRISCLSDPGQKAEVKFYIGGCDQYNDYHERQSVVVRARCSAAKLLGRLSQYLIKPMPGVEYPPDETPDICYIRILVTHLCSRSSVQRMTAGSVIREWALLFPEQACHPQLQSALHTCLTEIVYYDEIALSFTRLQQEARDFMAMLRHYKLEIEDSFSASPFLTLEQIQNLSGPVALTLFSGGRLRPKVYSTLEERRKAIQNNVSQTSTDQISLATTTQAMIAGAIVRFRILPEKLSPVIKPLMDSIKKEKVDQLQRLAAEDLTKLLELCIEREKSPNEKVLKNLAIFLCVDQEFTPKVIKETPNTTVEDKEYGILSLTSQIKEAERLLRRTSSISGRGPGRPPANAKVEDPADVTEAIIDSQNQKLAEIQRRGCTYALMHISRYFGEELPQKMPQLWSLIYDPFDLFENSDVTLETSQAAINWLQLLEVVIPALHVKLLTKLEVKMPKLEVWLYHQYAAVRHMATRVIGALATVLSVSTMTYIVLNIIPSLEAVQKDNRRQGAIECIFASINRLGFDVVPYIVLLIVPLLGCMSDQDSNVRNLATHCFATLIRLLPLEGGVPDPPDMSSELMQQKLREREFLEHLLDPTKIESYKIPLPINAELRTYQQSGVNWLAFLNRYKLHGILCDDMGLGKTLQSICILSSDHFVKEKKQSSGKSENVQWQSLVVCPPTLTGHWVYEVKKFVARKYLNPLHYTGPPAERCKLRHYVPDHNLIVASYDIVRNDIQFFSQIKWNYVILDEGHIIKNGKTKSSKAIKQLKAQHRLILSGTPIQNNVLELWSLFDFLMPGFLGTERQFMARYSKPILQSRDAKSSSREQEAGVLAMEALHRQVLPFLLRRLKEDVLQDLPPKITQDYYCELSPLQEQLYEDFARTQANQNITDALRIPDLGGEESAPKAQSHVFQALQYLRKVCNHPKLVIKPQHPEYERMTAKLKESNSSLSDISHSAKLPALKQLLLDCGIGVDSVTGTEAVVSQHRALIFCQLKAMLDIIEKDLLKQHLPGVTYLRLDGSVPAGSRHALVQRFNADPSIDLLLLTTQVGGLGLNLTGADTVIFVEHDWNPMRDLQAMDRAHRIGQKKVVNVYRLITKGTLEEKIMGLQKFKVMTANTVISQENSSLLSMGTHQLLDLFSLDSKKGETSHDSQGQKAASTQALGIGTSGAKAVLDNLPELWDDDQYESEYDLTTFMAMLKK